MNYFLVTRHEVVTKQIVIRYVESQQKLAIILPEESCHTITFDVPWADNAFFDTLTSIGEELMARSEADPVKTVYVYENDFRIVVQIDDKMWQFKKPGSKGDTHPT